MCLCVSHLTVPKSVKVHSVLVQGVQLELELGHLRYQLKLLRLQRRSAEKFLQAKNKLKIKLKSEMLIKYV